MNRFLPLLLVAVLLLPAPAPAATPEEQGLAIAREADRRDSGFHDQTVTMTMILTNRHGERSVRHMRLAILEMAGDGDRSLLVVDSPPDVRGTALLTWAHKEGDDDQWLYLPALKRVKRISGRNRSGSFMGSEFSYEDIARQEVEKYTYRYRGEETVAGHRCLVNERFPVDPSSGYRRQVVWLDAETYQPRKVEYYDRKDALLKTLTLEQYKKYDQWWRPAALHMVNHQTGKKTDLSMTDYRFHTGLTAADFTRNRLKRLR